MKRFLFQGDSITDAMRNRDNEKSINTGYVHIVASQMLLKYPGKFEFFNRGIGGNRIIDVYARIKSDIINLKPDYMSLLIGVNDVWHELELQNGIDANKFKTLYKMLISEIKAALPNIKIYIMAPFLLKGNETTENWELFSAEVKKRAEVAKEIAEEFNLIFIPLQEEFDKALLQMPEEYWIRDGVHPLEAGQALIADALLKRFEKDITDKE
ncbi:MAG: SGNH/GDSL hydrolase family protein [Clostridia bacterium]|nr:SGNH/GDSL hydrolase family protein [Clostridia bacterium]